MENVSFEAIREYCLSKKLAAEDTPFGPEALVFKVCGKMFALLTFDGEVLRINLKNSPEINLELREQYSFISPGYHMNKKYWNTILINDYINKDLLFSLVDQSYLAVVNGLPKKLKESLI
ncbi:MAG TPA: MmcQ/YjbR family DNA-binding protein [Cytophagales bacterium]|nr:MmcQ/YjbR family DNA-binding protein [Cytophagales bacterium]